MADERRYSDEEAEEIFRSAAAAPVGRRGLPPADGLTLAELQAIGREAGMAPEQIAHAAARLDLPSANAVRGGLFGVASAVGHSVELPRAPTDHEWGILVAELRELFAAQGREGSAGTARSWHNGNLRIAIEPTEAGYRLRMRTRKSSAAPVLAIGALFVVLAISSLLFPEGGSIDLVRSVLLALLGVGALTFNAVRLSSWSSERREQMEHFAERTVALLSRPAAP